jgi:hypothetical protein
MVEEREVTKSFWKGIKEYFDDKSQALRYSVAAFYPDYGRMFDFTRSVRRTSQLLENNLGIEGEESYFLAPDYKTLRSLKHIWKHAQRIYKYNPEEARVRLRRAIVEALADNEYLVSAFENKLRSVERKFLNELYEILSKRNIQYNKEEIERNVGKMLSEDELRKLSRNWIAAAGTPEYIDATANIFLGEITRAVMAAYAGAGEEMKGMVLTQLKELVELYFNRVKQELRAPVERFLVPTIYDYEALFPLEEKRPEIPAVGRGEAAIPPEAAARGRGILRKLGRWLYLGFLDPSWAYKTTPTIYVSYR